MTDPAATIRKLLSLAARAGTAEEALLANRRVVELAGKYKIDLARLLEAPDPVAASSLKYDWFNGCWVTSVKW